MERDYSPQLYFSQDHHLPHFHTLPPSVSLLRLQQIGKEHVALARSGQASGSVYATGTGVVSLSSFEHASLLNQHSR